MGLTDAFLEGQIHEFDLKVNITLDEKEFQELIGNSYDSSNGITEDGVTTDEYVYSYTENVMKKLILEYVRQPDNKYALSRIQGFNEWVRE